MRACVRDEIDQYRPDCICDHLGFQMYHVVRLCRGENQLYFPIVHMNHLNACASCHVHFPLYSVGEWGGELREAGWKHG